MCESWGRSSSPFPRHLGGRGSIAYEYLPRAVETPLTVDAVVVVDQPGAVDVGKDDDPGEFDWIFDCRIVQCDHDPTVSERGRVGDLQTNEVRSFGVDERHIGRR